MRLALGMFTALALAACGPAATTATDTVATTSAVAGNPAEGVTVNAPAANARVTSPLVATGVAPANWFFEAQFQAKLLAADGSVIAEGPAMATEDWTNGNPTHPFRAELTFSVAHDTPATLLLQEDMPPDEDHPEARATREMRIPVTLAAR